MFEVEIIETKENKEEMIDRGRRKGNMAQIEKVMLDEKKEYKQKEKRRRRRKKKVMLEEEMTETKENKERDEW